MRHVGVHTEKLGFIKRSLRTIKCIRRCRWWLIFDVARSVSVSVSMGKWLVLFRFAAQCADTDTDMDTSTDIWGGGVNGRWLIPVAGEFMYLERNGAATPIRPRTEIEEYRGILWWGVRVPLRVRVRFEKRYMPVIYLGCSPRHLIYLFIYYLWSQEPKPKSKFFLDPVPRSSRSPLLFLPIFLWLWV